VSIDSDDEEEDEPMDEAGENAEPDDLPNISLEDLLPEPEEDEPAGISASPEQLLSSAPLPIRSIESVQSNNWLEYTLDSGSTKRLHKASILSSLFNSDYRHLAVGRLLRV
jgi:hypothetical protein